MHIITSSNLYSLLYSIWHHVEPNLFGRAGKGEGKISFYAEIVKSCQIVTHLQFLGGKLQGKVENIFWEKSLPLNTLSHFKVSEESTPGSTPTGYISALKFGFVK